MGYFLDYRQLESYTGNGTIGAVPDGSLVVFNRDFESSVLAGVRNRSITILNSYGRTTLVQDGQVIATDNGYPRLVSATTGAYLRPFVWYKFDGLNCSWDSSGNQNHFSPSAVTACLTEYYNGLLYPTTVNSIKGDMSAMFRAFGGNQVTRVRIPSFNWESMQKTFGFSIAFWMNRPYGYESMQAEMILSLSEFLTDPCTLFNNFRLFRSGSARSTTFLLYGNVILTNYMPSQIQPGVYEVDGYWHHHVISVTKQGVWTTWIDGIDMNTSFIGNFTDVYPGNQRLMTIGGEVCQDRQNLYAGMDDFRIYPAPLTSTQVRELYLGTVGVYTVQYSPCNSTACSQDTHLHCTTYGAPVCCGYGTYFLEGTSDECVPCPAGTNSDGSGSTCTTCPAGQYLQGETCRDCVAGAYSSTVSQSACTACPAGSYSALARASSSSVCTNCSAGTYQPTPGAISVSNCTACPSGTYLVDQGAASPLQCVRCDAGKYSRTVAASSSSTCQICVAGTFSTGQGSTDISNCTNCTAGTYSSTPGATAVSACIQCAAGLYASALGSTACTACPSQSNTSSTGSAQRAACVCYPGTFGLPAAFQACGLCPANYYCNSTTQLPCPYGTLSFPGSITVSKCGCPLNASAPLTGQGCACDPGFRQATNGLSLGGWDCRACEANTYCLAGGQLLCPDFSASTVLSGSILDCKCNRGYYWNGTLLQCVTCPVDSYCNGGLVYRCPASTFSPMRSSSQAECRCSAGYACSRTRQTRLTITFRLDAAQFQAQQAIVRQKLAILAGVPESSVVLNSTNGVGRRLLESQYVEISAHVPVENLPGDVMILH